MRGALAFVTAFAAAGCGRIDFAVHTDARGNDTPLGAIDAPSLADGLVAYYPLDAISGGAADASGNGHDATCSTDCPVTTAGQVGGAAAFDGATQMLSVPFDVAFNTTTAFTVAAWIHPSAVGNYSAVAKPHDVTATANSWQLEIPQSDNLSVKVRSASQADVFLNKPTVAVGAWQHIAGVWTGTTLLFYVDGTERNSTPVNDVMFDANPIVIGADLNSGAPIGYWLGSIDEVRIYSRALTPAEIVMLATP